MRVQYADALESCKQYWPINYQMPNEVISRLITLPGVLALTRSRRSRSVDGTEIHPSAPKLAWRNVIIWSSRPSKRQVGCDPEP
jgi:hypothetical protein